MTLWRGENIDRLESGRIGSAWTDKESTAKMFASGLNATGKGGIVLRVEAPGSAIIAGPSAHSANWLGENEYTVDVAQLAQIERLERFAPSIAAAAGLHQALRQCADGPRPQEDSCI